MNFKFLFTLTLVFSIIFFNYSCRALTFEPSTAQSTGSSITITAPNSSSNWDEDSSYYIQWSSSENISYVILELYNGSSRLHIIDSYEYNDGSYYWSISNSPYYSGSNHRVKITDYFNPSIYSYSAYFTITE